MNILFVCKYNRFRSKVAEAIFNSLNKNKKIKVKSGGFTATDLRVTDEEVVEILRKKGYSLKKVMPKQITKDFLEKGKFDLIVIAANDVPLEFFKQESKAKILHWKISDCPIQDMKCVKNSINQIEKEVKILVKDLKDKGC